MSITGYLGIGGLIVMLSLGLVAYHYKVQARDALAAQQAAERSLATALEVNADNEKQMTALENARSAADKLAAELADEVAAANQNTIEQAMTITKLRAANADVDNFLKLPVPPALRGVYADRAKSPH